MKDDFRRDLYARGIVINKISILIILLGVFILTVTDSINSLLDIAPFAGVILCLLLNIRRGRSYLEYIASKDNKN